MKSSDGFAMLIILSRAKISTKNLATTSHKFQLWLGFPLKSFRIKHYGNPRFSVRARVSTKTF